MLWSIIMNAPQPYNNKSNTKKCSCTIHLNIPSTILLLIGILSSSYLAYRDGQRASNFITKLSSHMERVHHPHYPPSLAPTQQPTRPFIGSLGSEVDKDKGQFTHNKSMHVEYGDHSNSSNHSGGEGGQSSSKQEIQMERLPSGQHLFIDIQNVNINFLTSEIQLSNAMINFSYEARLPLLSYHCHELPSYSSKITKPTNDNINMGGVEEESNDGAGRGKTCVAILLNGHMTLHTWPNDNVIVLDLFTSQQQQSQHDVDLIPLIPLLEEQFAIPTNNNLSNNNIVSNKPKLHWGHKLRGFRSMNPSYQQDKNPYDQELGEDILRRRSFDIKRSLISTKTKYQSVDVYELQHDKDGTVYAALGRGRDTAIKKGRQDGDLMLSVEEEEEEEEIVAPDRVLFIDGVLQSSYYGEAAYHESLVHPALLSHSDPKRVAIIGGGEGATLREVLKHNTVNEVVMIEIDEGLTNISREYIPEWSDCSDILDDDRGRSSSDTVTAKLSDSCFDNPRATVHFQDAFAYFLDEFGEEYSDDDDAEGYTEDDDDEELFDSIIMDALDPDDFGIFVDKLYNDTDFIRSLYNGLTESGILVAQVGAIPQYEDPPDDLSPFYNRAAMLRKLDEVGFKSIHVYDTPHCHFYEPWQILVAFKDGNSKANWSRNSAEIELALHHRLYRTKSGKSPLRYFDGSTMATFQVPPKVIETLFCRSSECREFKVMHPVSWVANQTLGGLQNLVRGDYEDVSNSSVYDPVTDRSH